MLGVWMTRYEWPVLLIHQLITSSCVKLEPCPLQSRFLLPHGRRHEKHALQTPGGMVSRDQSAHLELRQCTDNPGMGLGRGKKSGTLCRSARKFFQLSLLHRFLDCICCFLLQHWFMKLHPQKVSAHWILAHAGLESTTTYVSLPV